ncbi:MAG: DNA-binding Lrp family transcriptional regulator [Candidatus Nitrosomirales archaeon]|jgi:DNA-binding Lrp family transcriptional regulator
MRAYVEIDIESGRDVIASAEFIRQIDGVKEAYAVSEHCDIYAVIEAADFKNIYEIVMRKIQVIRGVTDTRILPCIDMESQQSTTVDADIT